MNVFLDTNDNNVVGAVEKALSEEYTVHIREGIQDVGLDPKRPVKNSVVIYYGSGIFDHLSVEDSRMAQLAFATNGDVLFTDKTDQSPMYAGPIPVNMEERVSTHLKYASRRKDLFGKGYIGQTYVDPKNILLTCNGFPDTREILKHSPDNWWYTIGFLKATSVDQVVDFFYDFPYVQPVVLDSSSLDILSGTEVEYSDASELDFTSPRSGILLRDLTRRPETWGVSIG